MKKNTLLKLFFIFLATHFYAQQHRITFEYDIAGNQIKRNVCFGCAARIANQVASRTKPVEKETLPQPMVESNGCTTNFPSFKKKY
jgi:hypothetical protein